jgi:hypothetical protein
VNDLTWRKSSYSGGEGGNCVEVATRRKSTCSGGQGGECVEVATWRKSTYSSGQGGNCVEVAAVRTVFVRDTTDRAGVSLTVTGFAWAAFVAAIRES